MRTPQADEKPKVTKLIFQRLGFLIIIALLIYLALRTEPLGAVALAITITVVTWVQVLAFNSKIKNKGLYFNSNEFTIDY